MSQVEHGEGDGAGLDAVPRFIVKMLLVLHGVKILVYDFFLYLCQLSPLLRISLSMRPATKLLDVDTMAALAEVLAETSLAAY